MSKGILARRGATVRADAMQWAMFTASLGEDPLMILARAQLYEDYIRSGCSPYSQTPVTSPAAGR